MKRVMLVYFSPTHTTKKILKSVAQGLAWEEIVDVDLTLPKNVKKITVEGVDLVIIGAPVYSGRLPVQAKERFESIEESNIPIVCVSVFGNRNFDDALVELMEMMQQKSFFPLAGASFIGEHSFSNRKNPIAEKRPNDKDLSVAREFGRKIREKMQGYSGEELRASTLDVPGMIPKGKTSTRPLMASEITGNCIKCMSCLKVCPTAAIDKRLKCDANKCIACFACVKTCPLGARELKHPMIDKARLALSKLGAKEPIMYI